MSWASAATLVVAVVVIARTVAGIAVRSVTVAHDADTAKLSDLKSYCAIAILSMINISVDRDRGCDA